MHKINVTTLTKEQLDGFEKLKVFEKLYWSYKYLNVTDLCVITGADTRCDNSQYYAEKQTFNTFPEKDLAIRPVLKVEDALFDNLYNKAHITPSGYPIVLFGSYPLREIKKEIRWQIENKINAKNGEIRKLVMYI